MGNKSKQNPSIALDYGKIPPQAIDFEEAILGALLLEPGSFVRVSHLLRKPEAFYKESHQIILNAIISLHDENIGVDLLLVTERLRKQEELENVGGAIYLMDLMNRVASDKHLLFYCTVVTDKFLLRELIRIGSNMQEKAFDETSDPADIAEWAENELKDKFDLDIEGRANFKDALTSTLLDISNKAKGITTTFVRTGDKEVDKHISFRLRQVCLIAGAEGAGKTKWMTYLAKCMLDNNKDIAILWFSMEDSKEQIIRSFISMEANLTTKQLQSINYTMSAEETQLVQKIGDNFNEYNIEFIDRVSSINTIMRKAKQFKDRHLEKMIIIIIDNLGLISTDSYYKGTEKDDFLASKIKDLSDQTESSIFLLHHMTKESAKAFNLKEGYRPRKEHIRGSQRILDYVQQALMINLPRKYKDLVSEEKAKAKMFNIKERTGRFDRTRFLMEFWTINDKGDKTTKNLQDLQERTWEELKLAVATERASDGSEIGAGYILNKYVEYSIYIDEVNRHREDRYKSEKMSIYSYIMNKKYKENFKPKPNSRTFYLYGDDMKMCERINEIFIAEAIKNRDGEDIEDNNIIRYSADLNHNIFKPLNEKTNEQS